MGDKVSYELEMYEIVRDKNGIPHFVYYGYIWDGHDNHFNFYSEEEQEWTYCIEEMSGEIPVSELLEWKNLGYESALQYVTDVSCGWSQRGGGISDDEARDRYEWYEKNATFLFVDDVNMDTPDGDYWCH